jgi:type II secretory pathway pseudopilin PulG
MNKITIHLRQPVTNEVLGATLAGLMITCSIITLLAVIAIPQLLRSRMAVNESAARVTLKTLSAALETYAAESEQGYPKDLSVLITANPPILNEDYIANSPIQGYIYTCQSLDVSGYSCSAKPYACERTGSKNYTITTGGVLIETDCSNE